MKRREASKVKQSTHTDSVDLSGLSPCLVICTSSTKKSAFLSNVHERIHSVRVYLGPKWYARWFKLNIPTMGAESYIGNQKSHKIMWLLCDMPTYARAWLIEKKNYSTLVRNSLVLIEAYYNLWRIVHFILEILYIYNIQYLYTNITCVLYKVIVQIQSYYNN